jgi:hypothetical protein
MTTNYVNSWTFKEAIREILQNCIDQEIVNPDNKVEVHYESESQKLIITNTLSTLDRKSLLLGASTKSDDAQTVGKFGEGYKLALLVLCRLGYKVKILNYGKKEKWTPAIRRSKQFESEVLCIDIEKYIFTSVPDANLSFVIHDVTEEEYREVVERTLQLQEVSDSSRLFSEYGEVLLSDTHAKSLFVNGLFICRVDKLQHGYNFKPQYINLDRDRSVVRDFDLFWLTSQVWISLWKENKELVEDMIESGVHEIEYIQNLGSYSINDSLLDRFISKYGSDSVPVTNDDQVKLAKESGRKPVIVSQSYYTGITSSALYSNRYPTQKVKSPREILQDFYDEYSVELAGVVGEAFEKIIETSEGWEVK